MKSQEAAPDSEQKKGLNDCEPLMARSKYKLTLPAGELGVAPASTVSLGWPRLAGTEQAASLKEMQKWSGYSVDRRGFYCPDGELGLWTKDPMNRPFWRVPGRFEKNELEDHLLELFPERAIAPWLAIYARSPRFYKASRDQRRICQSHVASGTYV
jgi:hypothetical protein